MKQKSKQTKRNLGGTDQRTTPRPNARRRFGQHFLEAPWVAKVITAIAPQVDDRLIEIGAGGGALTFALAERVDRLLAIEVDRDLVRILRGVAGPTINTIEADFLDLDLPTLARRLGDCDGTVRIVGNLPYNVSVPILLRVLRDAARAGIRDAVFMLQQELSARVVADPGSRAYGPLAVMTALRADATLLLDLPPGAFRPAPRVQSSLISLRFRKARQFPSNVDLFEAMIRSLFTQRRKQLVNALSPIAAPYDIDTLTWCQRARVEPKRRPGDLALSELVDLSEVLASALR